MATNSTTNATTIDFKSGGTTDVKLESTASSELTLTGPSSARVHVIGTNIEYNRSVVNASTYTVQTMDYFVAVTYTATGTCTVTLPEISSVGKRVYIITDEGGNASNNNITIERGGSDTILGQTSTTITGDYNTISLYNDGGTKWFYF